MSSTFNYGAYRQYFNNGKAQNIDNVEYFDEDILLLKNNPDEEELALFNKLKLDANYLEYGFWEKLWKNNQISRIDIDHFDDCIYRCCVDIELPNRLQYTGISVLFDLVEDPDDYPEYTRYHISKLFYEYQKQLKYKEKGMDSFLRCLGKD